MLSPEPQVYTPGRHTHTPIGVLESAMRVLSLRVLRTPLARSAQVATETRSHEGHEDRRATLPHRLSIDIDLVRLESRSPSQITHPLVQTQPPWIHSPGAEFSPSPHKALKQPWCSGPTSPLHSASWQFWEPGTEVNIPLPGSCPHTERPSLSSAPTCPLSCTHAMIQARDRRHPHAPNH